MTDRTGSFQRPRRRLDRGTLLTAAALLAIATAAWVALVLPSFAADAAMPGMDAEVTDASGPIGSQALGALLAAAMFVGAWLVMMTAMMLPSAAPMVLLYRATATGSSIRKAAHTGVFVAGYLLAWGVFGLTVYLIQEALAVVAREQPALGSAWPFVVAGVLAGAGVYQFSPLKYVCLRQCRSPVSFLMTRWRPGVGGGFRLGLHHGSYCVGCCWGLMAVLAAAGAMGLAWVALIALVIFAEKLLPQGESAARIVGTVLIGLSLVILLRPEVASRLPT